MFDLLKIEEILKSVKLDEAVTKGLDELCKEAKLSDEAKNAILTSFAITEKFKKDISGDLVAKAAEIFGLVIPKDTTELDKVKADLQKAQDDLAKALVGKDETIVALQKQVADLTTRIDQTTVESWTKVVKDAFSNMVLPGIDRDAALDRVVKASPEAAKELLASYQKISDDAKKSGLFKADGSAVDGDLSDDVAQGQLEKLVAEKMAKDQTLSKHKAWSQVLDENPALYYQYSENQVAKAGVALE